MGMPDAKEKHSCGRCKKPVSAKYQFCFECRELNLEEDRIRDAILIRTCAELATEFPEMPAADVAKRALAVATAAVAVRKLS